MGMERALFDWAARYELGVGSRTLRCLAQYHVEGVAQLSRRTDGGSMLARVHAKVMAQK